MACEDCGSETEGLHSFVCRIGGAPQSWLKAMHDAAEAKEALCRIALEMRAEGISRWDRFSIACDAYRDAEALRVKEALADRAQARRELVVKLFNRGV